MKAKKVDAKIYDQETFQIGKYYRTNLNIPLRDLRVIDEKGEMLGVINRDEAYKIAQEKGLDLVEIASQATPPVARIIDFEKFKYDESKKEQAAKKHAKDVELKELWFSPRIADHDLQTQVRKAEEFIKENHKVMIRIKFRGREMGHQELGRVVLQKILTLMGERIQVEREAKFEGRSLTAILGRSSGTKPQKQEKEEEKAPINEETSKTQEKTI